MCKADQPLLWQEPDPLCLDGLILPGWKPEFDPRQVHADCDNVPQMLDALQIDGIVPAEVSVFGAFPNVKAAMEKRLRSLTHPRWIDAVSVHLTSVLEFTKFMKFRGS